VATGGLIGVPEEFATSIKSAPEPVSTGISGNLRAEYALGFSFTGGKLPQRRTIAPQVLVRVKARVKALTKRNQGRSLNHVITTLSASLRGWRGEGEVGQTPAVLRDLDSGLRPRLRALPWKHWKSAHRRKAEVIKGGSNPTLAPITAWSAPGPGRMSHPPGVRLALHHHFFDHMGLIRLRAHYHMEPA
jgi:RNA-directed DNA polymerase